VYARQYLHMRTSDQRSDSEILVAAANNPAAFKEIFERHFESVHRFVARQLDLECADDATAEVFLRALRGVSGYQARSPDALPWLLGIAANVVRAELRDRYRSRVRSLELIGAREHSARADGELETVGRLAEVQRALNTLSSEEREPLLMFAWLDQPYESIAVALGIPVGTVRSRIARARRQLRHELGMEGPEVLSAST